MVSGCLPFLAVGHSWKTAVFQAILWQKQWSLTEPVFGSTFDYDTENMNSEDIYSSLRGVTEAIQNFSFRSQEDMNEPVKRDPKRESDGELVSSHTL